MRTPEERVMDAAWGRLEAPETTERRRVAAHGANPLPAGDVYGRLGYYCAFAGCEQPVESLDDVMTEHPAT